jgi:hypothetical protein
VVDVNVRSELGVRVRPSKFKASLPFKVIPSDPI